MLIWNIYDILHENVKFVNLVFETLLSLVQFSVAKDVVLTIPKMRYPFIYIAIFQFFGIGFALLHLKEKVHLDVISSNSQILATIDQKLSTTYQQTDSQL